MSFSWHLWGTTLESCCVFSSDSYVATLNTYQPSLLPVFPLSLFPMFKDGSFPLILPFSHLTHFPCWLLWWCVWLIIHPPPSIENLVSFPASVSILRSWEAGDNPVTGIRRVKTYWTPSVTSSWHFCWVSLNMCTDDWIYLSKNKKSKAFYTKFRINGILFYKIAHLLQKWFLRRDVFPTYVWVIRRWWFHITRAPVPVSSAKWALLSLPPLFPLLQKESVWLRRSQR